MLPTIDWIPRKARFVLGALAVLSLLVPTGISHDTVITGHTVFKNAAGYDPCLASVVGIARSQVLWFNEQALFSTNAEGDYLYATRSGAPSPVGETIYGDAVVFEFVDPNNHRWVVIEGYYYTDFGVDTPDVHGDFDDLPPDPASIGVEGGLRTELEYVWIVQIGPTYEDMNAGGDAHRYYNFVTIVDTCKFGVDRETNTTHEADDPNHPPGEVEHAHDVFAVDLYIDVAPTLVPIGPGANPNVTTEWTGTVGCYQQTCPGPGNGGGP